MNTEENMKAAGFQKPEAEQSEEQQAKLREIEERLHRLAPLVEMPQPKDPEIERRFTYHAPTPSQVKRYEQIRDFAKEFAYLLIQTCPNSRERSLALTHLEDVVYCANASIARNEE